MNFLKKIELNLIIILSIHFFIRIFIYLSALKNNELYFEDKYIEAINNNFFEYIFYHHSLTLGPHFISKTLLSIFGNTNLYFHYYFLNCIYTSIVLVATYQINKKFFENKIFLNIIIFIVSLSLVPYESWRVNHYDHIVLPLLSLLALFLYNLFHKKKIQKNENIIIYFSLVMIFLIFSSTLFIVFFLITLFCIFIFKRYIKIDYKKFFFYILFIIIIFLSLLYKNKIVIDQFTPTSIKGWSHIQRTLYSIGSKNFFDLTLSKVKLTEIYKLCLNDIILNNERELEKNKSFFLPIVLNQCFFDFEKKIYDYNKLKDVLYINKIQDENLLKFIQIDQYNIENKKWLLSGGHSDLNLLTTVFFHKESFKIYIDAFKFYPKQMLIGSPYSSKGEGLFFSFIKMFMWGGQLPNYYEPQHTGYTNIYFYYLMILISIFILISLIFSLVIFFKTFKKKFLSLKLNKTDILISSIVLIIISFVFITALMTCCENQRNTVMIYPLLMINSLLVFFRLIKKFKKNK